MRVAVAIGIRMMRAMLRDPLDRTALKREAPMIVSAYSTGFRHGRGFGASESAVVSERDAHARDDVEASTPTATADHEKNIGEKHAERADVDDRECDSDRKIAFEIERRLDAAFAILAFGRKRVVLNQISAKDAMP